MRADTARLALLVSLAATVGGCVSPMRDAPNDLPARPALGPQIERVGRALTGNALLGPLTAADVIDARKEEYNRVAPVAWAQFASDIERTLGLYDGFDGECGNAWLAAVKPAAGSRYGALARMLADDRLWVNSASTTCTEYLAVELAEVAGSPERPWQAADEDQPTLWRGADCGGRTPNDDAVDIFRSLLVDGYTVGVNDGVAGDDRRHSTTVFPFLAAP